MNNKYVFATEKFKNLKNQVHQREMKNNVANKNCNLPNKYDKEDILNNKVLREII